MYIYALIVLLFTFGYSILILLYLKKWNELPTFNSNKDEVKTRISVVIPAKDENENIGNLLKSILAQNYPQQLIEVIVVNDHSTDNMADIVCAFEQENIHLINLSEVPLKEGEIAYKKRAIETGINRAVGEIIVTTDADCTFHKNWLRTIAQKFETEEVNMLSAPVLFNFDESLFQKFQALDFIGMIGITAASINMEMFNLANGANLAFRKAIFQQVNGFEGIDKKASGDDMLLIYKFAQVDASKVQFLKSEEAIAYTKPAETLSEFVQQRLRWTSKSFEYQDQRITYILAFVYLVNLLLPTSLILFFTSKFQFLYLGLFALQFVLMSIVDFVFLKRVSSFFSKKSLMKVFVQSQFMHVLYILIIGLLGNFVSYKWKGRKLK